MSKSNDLVCADPARGAGEHATGEARRQLLSVRKRRRLRWMRVSAVLFPFLALGLLELSFRFAGAYESPELQAKTRLEVKDLPPGTRFFSEWDRQIVVPKPANTRRLFVLGGSSAMGFGVDRPFAQRLQTMLNAQETGQNWEVFNGAVSAYGSQRVRAILERAVEFEPDLIIVYLGHNEFLEDVFYDPDGLLGRIERTTTFAQRIRVVNFVRSLIRSKHQQPRAKPRLQQHFLGNTKFPLIHTKRAKQARLRFLADNLRMMAEHCQRHQVQLILIPAVANLLSPPGNPRHGWEAESPSWYDVLLQSRIAMQNGDYVQLDKLAQRLITMDPHHAVGHYFAGLAAMAQNDLSRGRRELNEALRLDWRGDRAGPVIQATILNAAKTANVTSIDMRADFASRLSVDFQRSAAGRSLQMFLDHCHPSQDGHNLIARLCLPIVLERLAIECR